MSKATDDVLAERQRQIEAEGWTEEHDDQHSDKSMATAGAAYALKAAGWFEFESPPHWWPWSITWWKPKNQRRDLVRAAALMIAEIERLDRAALKAPNIQVEAPAQGSSRLSPGAPGSAAGGEEKG